VERDDDIQLWLAYREGERDALGSISERYYKTLLRYGLKFAADRFVVEDCIQNIFLELWRNRLRISATPSVKSYLFKALRHAVMHHRNYQRRFSYLDDHEWEISFPDHFNAETYLVEKESFAAVLSHLQAQLTELPKRQREAVYLRYYEDMEVHEIAEIMGVNRQSVSNFLQKAILRLRTHWMVPLAICVIFS
jgi:RNA polymerase sigma factor (sigma-70 family)